MSLSAVARAQSSAVSSKATLRALPSVASASTVCSPSPVTAQGPPPAIVNLPSQRNLPPIWFNSSLPRFEIPSSPGDQRGPDNERKVKLGKTLRILQERLPSLLQSPLPQEILSPNITLHLFPSTHPYLPTVSGRVAYIAALWTSPLAWNRVPIIGNLKLEILSERMVSRSCYPSPKQSGAYGEQLIVKWRSADGKSKSPEPIVKEDGERKLDNILRGTQKAGEKTAFTGIFIFEFDEEGRVISHTIEHVDEHGEWDKGVGARVVGLTDWLLGGIKGRTDGTPALCRCRVPGKDGKGVR
ncbi:hypothetical protein GGR52DRAFT_62418 [Hypoxylon sp. FL1284]|nr:hypothetical protein GGR52DRAFT_62418 [Hypoxylon sp. FL1284]